MNKSLFTLPALMLALTACSSDEIVEQAPAGGEISFRTTTQANGRSAENFDRDPLIDFNVSAYGNNEPYFTDVTFSRTSKTEWNSEFKYYWPGYALDFTAYAPTTLKDEFDIDIDRNVLTIDNFMPKAMCADQHDFILAMTSGSAEQYAGTGIPMEFRHQLAQVNIRAAISRYSRHEVKIKAIRLTSVGTGATFTSTDGFSTSLADKANYADECAEPKTAKAVPSDYVNEHGPFLVIPQQLTAWIPNRATDTGARVSFLVSITNVSENNVRTQIFPREEGKYAWVGAPIDTKWEAGHNYDYTFDFTDGCGYVERDQTMPDANGYGRDKDKTYAHADLGTRTISAGYTIFHPIRLVSVTVEEYGISTTGDDLIVD